MTALAPLVRTGDAIVETAKARYTTKSYDASLRIPEADLQAVRKTLNAVLCEAQELPLDNECNEETACHLFTGIRADGRVAAHE